MPGSYRDRTCGIARTERFLVPALAGASGCMTRFSVKMNNWIGHPISSGSTSWTSGGAYVEERSAGLTRTGDKA